ncbi:MAG: DUF2300 domain-containing protein [Pseudomonadota bacterium]|nr:DUF2300 domain-containing protein [Pseudomonadota bacterium]
MSAAPILFAALFSTLAAAPPCQPQPLARQWLEQQLPRWQAMLSQEPGYRPPAYLQICALHARRPYADIARGRIYVAPPDNSNDAVSLVHEYLHLALAGHPHGRDEAYVEALAQRLVRLGATP